MNMGKVIDRNGRLFGKVSIIDVLVVLVVGLFCTAGVNQRFVVM